MSVIKHIANKVNPTKNNPTILREDFPVLQKKMYGKWLIYFDTAATAQKPQCVIDTITDFYQNHYGTVHRAVYGLAQTATDLFHKVRQQIPQFINAKHTHEIIFTKGTTESINLVAASFGKVFIQPGDEIIISEIEHHANLVPWQILCEEKQAVLKFIPVKDDGELDIEVYKKLLSEKTKLVSIAHISNVLGTIHPIKEMIALAHSYGARVLIDGAQAAPHMKIDVQDLDADFYTFSGHKMYGPTGVGVLYGKEDLLNALPPYQSGGDMIKRVTLEKTTYGDLPNKFEAGTPMIAEVIGLGAAIDYLSEIDFDVLMQWENELLDYATVELTKIKGVKILGSTPNKGAIISFTVDGVHHLDIGTLLDLQGIAVRTGHLCAQPAMERFGIPGTVRLSFSFYNTKEEIQRFIEVLKQILNQLRK